MTEVTTMTRMTVVGRVRGQHTQAGEYTLCEFMKPIRYFVSPSTLRKIGSPQLVIQNTRPRA